MMQKSGLNLTEWSCRRLCVNFQAKIARLTRIFGDLLI